MSYIQADRDTPYLLPPSVDEWLPANHLARFILEAIEQLNLSRMTQGYARRGSKAHHLAVLLALLVYGYATGVFSSRKIERASYDSVAFRYLAANTHPDHDTLATFRKRFLPELEELFVQVLSIAQTMKLLQLGQISLDGSKLKANASKHKALSRGHIEKLEAQLREEVQALLADAKAEIDARAKARFEAEQREYEAKVARREAQRQAGKPPHGKEPQPPEAGPPQAGSGQPDRRRVPDHAGLGRWFRTDLQRPGRGRYRNDVGAGNRGDATTQRQAPGRTDA